MNAIVRYRGGQTPALSNFEAFLSPDVPISPDLPLYNYLFVRGNDEDINRMKQNIGGCQLRLSASTGFWQLLEVYGCPP